MLMKEFHHHQASSVAQERIRLEKELKENKNNKQTHRTNETEESKIITTPTIVFNRSLCASIHLETQNIFE